MNKNLRRRYILRATFGYLLFAAIWIFFSDKLLTAFVDVTAIHWLSTAKGIFFVLVTTLLLFAALRAVPGDSPAQPALPRLDLMLDTTTGAGGRAGIYLFAVAVSLAMLLLRSGIRVSFDERPLLILFMFPIILCAIAGGLGPGLVATLVCALGTLYYSIPPLHSFSIAQPHDLFQWGFLIGNGVLVSVLTGVLHRSRRQTEASHRLQAVTLASIGDGVITTDRHGQVTFLNPVAEQLTGWSSRDATGRPLAMVFRAIDEQARVPVESSAQKVLASGEMVRLAGQAVLLSRDGREVPVQESGAPIQFADGTMAGAALVFRDDTQRRQAERVLQQERSLLKRLVQTLPDLVWLKNREGVYLACNARFEKFFGAREDQIVGRTDYDFVDRELADFFRRKDAEAIDRGQPTVNEEEVTFADDGHREILETIKTPMFDQQGDLIGVLGIARDITAARRAEADLRESEERFRDIAEISADWIWEVDQAGRYTFASENVEHLLGYKVAEIIGKTPFDLMPPETSTQVREAFGAISARRDAFRDLYNINLRKDGHPRHVLTSAVPVLNEQGELRGYRGLDRDISEKKEAEEALRNSLAEKVALLKEVHHRVKNNLQIVASLLNLQANRLANQEIAAVLLDTRNRVHSMAVLHEVLYRSESLARIELSTYIDELCVHLLRAFGRAAGRVALERKVATISLLIEQAVPCGLIVNELVTNALKYGYPDERSGRVIVRIALENGRIDLSVSDDGIGLPNGFDPAGAATLGLQLVKNLAGQLGGWLAWERPSEGGACFRVNFPTPENSQQGAVP